MYIISTKQGTWNFNNSKKKNTFFKLIIKNKSYIYIYIFKIKLKKAEYQFFIQQKIPNRFKYVEKY